MNDNELNEYLADFLSDSVGENKTVSAPALRQKTSAKKPAVKKTPLKAETAEGAKAQPAEEKRKVQPEVAAPSAAAEALSAGDEPVTGAAPLAEELTVDTNPIMNADSPAEAEPSAEIMQSAAPSDSSFSEQPTEETATYAEDEAAEEETNQLSFDGEQPLDRNLKLMSPGRMVARRFFRSKLSIIGLVLIAGLILFSWVGPLILQASGYGWGETDIDYTPYIDYTYNEITVTGDDGQTYTVYQVIETQKNLNALAYPSAEHLLGTDKSGMDVFARLMYGGRVSLSVSILTVFVIAILGIIFGGIAGYFGGKVDNVIMRICDIFMCIPGLPIMLIVGEVLNSLGVNTGLRIYYLMLFLSLISWAGTARLVRGQILYLREQEYMVAAEAMGFSTGRKIFKHLVPNVLPQLIVSMTLSLGSMILYEATLSYLGFGVKAPNSSWGMMINIVTEDSNVLANYFNVWGPPGICIILAVLGFNFLGDGLRDALDPKMRR